MSSKLILRSRQGEYLQRIRSSGNTVLEYDVNTGQLGVWKWPIDARGVRLKPADLNDHRRSHKFLGPCCLCPMLDPNGETSLVEASIVVVRLKKRGEEYVAQCASRRCGYFAFIERICNRKSVPTKFYPLRHLNDDNLPHSSQDSHGTAHKPERPLKRSYAMLDVNEVLPPQPQAVEPPKDTVWVQLLQRNSGLRPVLTEDDFQALFAKCACGMMTTRKVFGARYCRTRKKARVDGVAIDITLTTDLS